MKRFIKYFIASVLLILLPLMAIADIDYLASVQSIIDSHEAPDGVVFEIVSKDRQYLDWALPEAKRLSAQLRDRFPRLEIAIVSHGSEQFALSEKQLAGNAALNATVKSLVDSDVQLHVCATHAERNGVSAEEFSQLVDVAAEGPAQINDYIKLGYLRIKLVKTAIPG
jgi:intracellular sulfur oxidation DsrE/DsrF family protein